MSWHVVCANVRIFFLAPYDASKYVSLRWVFISGFLFRRAAFVFARVVEIIQIKMQALNLDSVVM